MVGQTNHSSTCLFRLKATGLNVRFATNTTKESQRLLHERLIKLGFPIDINEIFTSLLAARDVVMREKLNPYLMIDPKALEDFAACNYVNQSNIHQADSVVIGLYPDIFNYHSMNQAFHILLKKLPLIAVHKARYYKCKDGQLSLGPGPFVTALEYATDSKAIVVGKPAKQFFLQAINDFGIKPEECAMIGDVSLNNWYKLIEHIIDNQDTFYFLFVHLIVFQEIVFC